METEFATGLGQIILFDLILSGDNAVVIGVVASRLHGRQRRLAILFGAGGAVVLRIAFASIATLLLQIPIISLVGGLALFWVGWRLLAPHGDEEHHEAATTFWQALRLIILADVVMSLDNVLTIAGAAHGDILLLVIGLALSIPLLFVGSGLIAFATERLPLIIYAGSALIFRIAVVLIIEDPALHDRLIVEGREALNVIIEHVIPWLAAFAGPALYILLARRRGRPVLPFWARSSGKTDPPDAPTHAA
ncbi:MAG: TerC family protein [Chloroflexi bacterium]|nr:TerC family protein [Chloroflexota bacterium]